MSQIFRTAAAALPPAQRGLNPQLGAGESNRSGAVLSSICCQLHLRNSEGNTPGELEVDLSTESFVLDTLECEAIVRALKGVGYSARVRKDVGSDGSRLAISW